MDDDLVGSMGSPVPVDSHTGVLGQLNSILEAAMQRKCDLTTTTFEFKSFLSFFDDKRKHKI